MTYLDRPSDKVPLRSIWADRKLLPLRFRVSVSIGLVLCLAVVLYALGAGVYSIMWFTHREQATCVVDAVTGPLRANSRTQYWNVRTSCGTYSITTGVGQLSTTAASTMAADFDLSHSYLFTFRGWGSGRSIVAAREVGQ